MPRTCCSWFISSMPALQISASIDGVIAWIALAHATTESKSLSSSATGVALPLMPAIASWPRSTVRAVPITCAPRSASTRIVSRPMPELQPVTTMVLPLMSMPAVTSSAVAFAAKLLRGTSCASALPRYGASASAVPPPMKCRRFTRVMRFPLELQQLVQRAAHLLVPELRDLAARGQVRPRPPPRDDAFAVDDQHAGNVLDRVSVGDRVAVRHGDRLEAEGAHVRTRIARAVLFRVDRDDLDAVRRIVGLDVLQV